jgi:hypothetical protein
VTARSISACRRARGKPPNNYNPKGGRLSLPLRPCAIADGSPPPNPPQLTGLVNQIIEIFKDSVKSSPLSRPQRYPDFSFHKMRIWNVALTAAHAPLTIESSSGLKMPRFTHARQTPFALAQPFTAVGRFAISQTVSSEPLTVSNRGGFGGLVLGFSDEGGRGGSCSLPCPMSASTLNSHPLRVILPAVTGLLSQLGSTPHPNQTAGSPVAVGRIAA